MAFMSMLGSSLLVRVAIVMVRDLQFGFFRVLVGRRLGSATTFDKLDATHSGDESVEHRDMQL